MAPIPQTSTINTHFENKVIDNQGFFQTMEEEIPTLLSAAETRAQTRLEIRALLAQMKKQTFIHGIREWTAVEQENFFKKVKSEIMNAGIIASNLIREKIQTLIEDEIWREINDKGAKYNLQDGKGYTILEVKDQLGYQNFLDTSFISSKETTVIPLDLRLTVNTTESIQDAENKLNRYNGKYNALVLLDANNTPIGVIRAESIQEHKDSGHVTLEGIHILSQVFGYYGTSNNELKHIMQENDINIVPIIDSKTGVLIGILTGNSLIKKEVQYYSTTSITKLSLEIGMHEMSYQTKKE